MLDLREKFQRFKEKIRLPREEEVPLEFRHQMEEAARIIFLPRNFETSKFYDKYLAARILKKYLPSSGDLVYKYIWKRVFGAPNQLSQSESSISFAEEQTRKSEMVHWLAFIFMNSLMTTGLLAGETRLQSRFLSSIYLLI